MALLTIEGAATVTGVEVDTIRRFEALGLLPKPPVAATALPIYDDLALKRIGFIHHWDKLGTDPEQIRMLMSLVRELGEPQDQLNRMKSELLQEVRDQHTSLAALRSQLRDIGKF